MDARTIADPIPLAQALMRCPSVTPAEAGALEVAQRELEKLGFEVRRLKFGVVGDLGADRFDDHLRLGGDVVREVDDAHPSNAERGQNRVMTNNLAG